MKSPSTRWPMLTALTAAAVCLAQPSDSLLPSDSAVTAKPDLPAGGRLIARGNIDGRFRIGPGDVLEVRVFGRPELNVDAVRVDNDGLIQLPLLESGVKAGCSTEEEVASEISRRYREFLVEPRVTLGVKEFSSSTVDVLGAVQRPGSFQLRRMVRLRELLTLAGGPGPAAGDTVHVLHEPERVGCLVDESNAGLAMISFRSMLQGGLNTNPLILPGDLVQMVEARQAYVVGNVYKPSPILLNEPITMMRAIAMAGGRLPTSRGDIRLIRKTEEPQGQVQVLTFGVGDMERNKVEDPLLRAGDIVEVRISLTKTILKSLLSAASAATVYYPLYIIDKLSGPRSQQQQYVQ